MRLLSLGISLYLSLFSVLPTTVWEECAKLPELYQHYQCHRHDEPDHSLFDFLAEHYGGESAHHTQHHDHAKIPFKNSHASTGAIGQVFYLSGVMHWINTPGLALIPRQSGFHYSLGSPLEPLLAFWQPPKLS